jgi:glycosyltransferase involved in cell wall biosynthesis
MNTKPTFCNPKVSICVVTYNQQGYIAQCLQGLVDQELNCGFEVIVSDDCSTDATPAIIEDFRRRYPDVVKAHLHKRNMGAYENYHFVHQQTIGEYVAHVDGDDLVFPGKLQAQVQVLDADPGCAVVWHRMHVFNDSGSISVPNLPSTDIWPEGKVHLGDLLRFGSVSYHSSTMYRATARKTRLVDGHALDWFFAVEFLCSGYGRYLEGIFGGYRYNPDTGISRAGDGTIRMRRIYCQHLRHYLRLLPAHRRDIFVNCLINCLVDLRNHRGTWRDFFRVALSNFSALGVLQLPAALRRNRQINPRIL